MRPLCCPGRPQAHGWRSLFAVKLVFSLNAVMVRAEVALVETGWCQRNQQDVAACLLSVETQQKTSASPRTPDHEYFLLAGFLTCPIVFFQQKQEKRRIHLNLIIKYFQGDEAKGTVSKRNRWRLKTHSFSCCPLHTHIHYTCM